MISLAPLPVVRFAGVTASATTPVVFTASVPNRASMDGASLFTQGVLYDLVRGQIVMTDALDLTFGR